MQPAEQKTRRFCKKYISYKNALKCNGAWYRCLKKHVLITLILNKALHKPTKTRHQWTPQLIRSMLGVCIVNITKLQVLIYNAVEMKCLSWFLCWNRLCFWLCRWILWQNYSLINLAGNGEYSKPNPIFVACFSPKIWSVIFHPIVTVQIEI